MGAVLLNFQPLKSGQLNVVEDDPCEGRQKTATTRETIEKAYNIVLDSRQEKMYEIAEALGILEVRVQNILHEELEMQKLCTTWVPHLLDADQKKMHKQHFQQCFD